MNLRKQSIALLLFAALVLGFSGAYAGGKLANSTNDQEQQLKNDPESENSDGENILESPENMAKVAQAFNLIQQHYIEDVEDEQLIEGAIQGMLDTLEDPYSSYMDQETMERFNEQLESSFEGIGAEVSMVEGKVTIVAPIKDSPAEEVGLRPNDQILSIDQESIEGLDLNEAVEKMRGEKGSEVVLEIQRAGVSDPFEVTVVRDDIPIETVYPDIQTIDGKKTGILEMTSFSETTAEEFEEELANLEEEGIEGLVIDVRGNPGGLLNAVEDILEHLVPKDIPYIQIEDQDGEKTPYYTDLEEKKDYPITVLIDEGSASASEILAVAMKEMGYDVVGQASYGKGTVQQAVPLGDGSTVKLTFYKWLSPHGEWIDEEGVEPTIDVKQPDYYYANPVQVEEPLKVNETSEDIENIQQMLIGLGYDVDRTDGYFDEGMKQAVESFQRDHDIKPSGEVDEETSGLLATKIVEKVREGDDDKQFEEALKHLYK